MLNFKIKTDATLRNKSCNGRVGFSDTVRLILPMMCLLIFLPAINSCAVNPATGSANLVLMSENREKEIGLEGIIDRVKESGNSGAEYRAVAILSNGNQVWKSQGICRGKISDYPRGSYGFGYDPIFIPEEGGGGTFGELGKEIKNQISHRKKVMQGLSNLLKSPSR